MNPLAKLYSTIDSIKRVLGDALSDPKELLQRAGANAKEKPLTVDDAMAFGPSNLGAGIIVPGVKSVVSTLGIEDVVNRAIDMAKSGKSAWAVGTESEKALTRMRNPGEAMSVFIGPDGIPRIKLDTKNSKIAPSAGIETYQYGGEAVAKLPKAMQQGTEIPLSEFLLHPSLYQISDAAKTATVAHNPFLDIFGHLGSYSQPLNKIQLPGSTFTNARLRNDPLGMLKESVDHEATHLVQHEFKVRTGAKDTVESLREALGLARTQGSFRTPEQLGQIDMLLNKLDVMPESTAKDKAIDRIYSNIYGEWEARQGSQYGRSLPMMNERGSTL